MKKYLIALATLCLATTGLSLRAETLVYQAIDDFPSIEAAGAAPYYKDRGNGRNALAIDASIEDNRDIFARASASFTGSGGRYNVTIDALGEIDGEGEYRLLIDGVVVGSATNARVTQDWGVQSHVFADIDIPAGAEIAVESNAVTNGLIPEGDITAYARGRWRTVTMDSIDVTGPATDLAITVSASTTTPTTTDQVTFTISVANTHATTTATAPELSIELPDGFSLDTTSQCTTTANATTCALSEIAPGDSQTVSLVTTANNAGTAMFVASVSSDQSDETPANNTRSIQLTTQTADTTDNLAVDLQMWASADVAQAATGDRVEITLSVTNNSATTTATTPVAGAILPDSLVFQASSDCVLNDRAVTCNLAEITPGETRSGAFSVSGIRSGDAIIIASVSSVETESVVANNEHTLTLSLTGETIQREETPTPKASTPTASNSSGSGSMHPLLLLTAFAAYTARRRRRFN